jgi:hypothetical protein
MNISEKAKAYAEGKAVSALTNAIEAAYAEGYNVGFADGLASKEGEKPDDLKDDGVEYVDLGLPSGTKWAANYLMTKETFPVPLHLPFNDACKLNIPTEEQYKELEEYCRRVQILKGQIVIGTSYVGVNGKFVNYYHSEITYPGGGSARVCYPLYWLKDLKEYAPDCTERLTSNNGQLYMGYYLRVILVR